MMISLLVGKTFIWRPRFETVLYSPKLRSKVTEPRKGLLHKKIKVDD